MPDPGRGHLAWPGTLLLLAAVYAAGVAAVLFSGADDSISTWWPAAGIAVVLVVRSPRRRWWLLVVAIAVVSGLANLSAGRDPALAVVFGVANATEALVAGLYLTRGRDRPPTLANLDDFVRLTGAAVLGGVTIATVAMLGTVAVGDGTAGRTWLAVFASHTASTLLIVPVAIWESRQRTGRRPELVLQLTILIAVTVAVFSPDRSLTLTFLPLPFFVWAALRFDLRTVAWELVGFAVVVTFLSSHGLGPFGLEAATSDDAWSLGTVIQAYLLCVAMMSLPLAIAVGQQRRLLARVSDSEQLFRRNFTDSLVGMVLMRSGERLLEIVEVNEAASRILGVADPPVGLALDQVLDTPEPLDLIAARMLAGNLDGWKSRTGLRRRPGARVDVALSLLGTAPEPTFSAQLLDLTTEHEALRRLEAAERLTGATLDTTAALILVVDRDGRVVRVNAATTEVSGYSERELVGHLIWDTPLAPASAADVDALFTWPNRSGAAMGRETLILTRDGETRHVVWNSNVVRDEDETPAYAVMTGIDVSAERTAAGVTQHLLQAAITTALIGTDTQGLITVFNAGAEYLLGYRADEMVGRPFVGLLDPDELQARSHGATGAAAFARLVEGIEAGGETAARDWTWMAADGRSRTVSMTLSVAADDFAARVGYLCVGRDVTEARASQELLIAALEKERLAVERLRGLDEAKNEFVSTVSHELRTPVTSIVGYTEVLEDGSLVPPLAEQLPMLGSIARNARRLLALCDDLLTLSGLDSGAAHWEREALDLCSLLASIEESLRPALAGRDLRVTFDAAPEPVFVLGDRTQLERMLTNLLSNAVKFTEDGGHVECRIVAADGEAEISVSDTGLGIPLEEQDGLFQRFFRSSTAHERAIQGTGLGLSIVAAIVAAHGGRVDVRSAHLEGSTFTVRLPLGPPASAH